MRKVSLGVMMIAAVAAAEDPANVVRVREAIAATAPKKVKVGSLVEKDGAVTVRGVAASYETVAVFMRSLANLVRTPRGYAQLVERRGRTVMVQLLAPNSDIEEMPAVSLLGFKVELLKTDNVGTKPAPGISFELKVALRSP